MDEKSNGICLLEGLLVVGPTLIISRRGSSRIKLAKIYKTAVDPAPVPSGSSSPYRHSTQPRHITAMLFDDRGDKLITAAEDETFRLYNCKTGKLVEYVTNLYVVTLNCQ